VFASVNNFTGQFDVFWVLMFLEKLDELGLNLLVNLRMGCDQMLGVIFRVKQGLLLHVCVEK
jgi:hypothetical protein